MPSIEYLLISLGITAHFVMKWGWSQVRLPALIGFSISFYTLSSPINLWIPFYCSLVCHFVGPRIITKKTISKCWLLSGVVLIALPLIFFKYLGRSHILLLPYSLEMLTLPLGISFFTFQAISYLIDLSRGQLTKCHSLSHLILYILYFPKIIAGPIERQNSFSKQIQLNTDINYTKFRSGLWLIAVGLFKKKALADRFFPVVD
ncbi:MAG: hypothetical protein KDD35_10355, partial [Bdellovibrionales bacterium]|nr:hypothetical protein [Bdellovibrionales bacterium]